MNVCRNRRFFTAAAAAVLGVLVLAEPQAAKQGFASGTALCLDSVLPALFPFFVVCELLMAAPPPAVLLRPLQRVLGLESAEAAQAVVLSWVGGYAVCARLAGQLYDAGRISRRDAVRLQILGCCSGPGFVIGCVGGLLLGNVRLGVMLYAAQIGANLAAGVVCLFGACGRTRGDAPDLRDGCGGRCASPPRGRMQASAPTVQQVSISTAITSAVTSSLSVCGCVVFFRLVGAVLGAVIPLPSVLSARRWRSAPGVRTLRCWAGRRRCTAAAQCSACWGCRSGRRCSSSPGQRSVRRCCSPAACCILCFCRAFYGSACGFCRGMWGCAARFLPGSYRFCICRPTLRRRGSSFSAQPFTRPGKTFIINSGIFLYFEGEANV